MQLSLGQDQVAALREALDYYIPQLREEIGRTEDYDMREGLKAQEAALNAVFTKLGGSLSDTETPDIGAKNPPWGDYRR